MIIAFIDQQRSRACAVESIVRGLRELGVMIAARTYLDWRSGRVAGRAVSDAQVVDAVRDLAWETAVETGAIRLRRLAPEGLYGRRKMTALVRRERVPGASPAA